MKQLLKFIAIGIFLEWILMGILVFLRNLEFTLLKFHISWIIISLIAIYGFSDETNNTSKEIKKE